MTYHLFTCLLIALGLALQPAAQAQPDSYPGEEVVLPTETGDLHGTLLVPLTETPPPVVFIHPGSGPTDRDGNNPQMQNNSLKLLAEALYDAGIASLRIDKRGIAGSQGAAPEGESKLTFDTYVNDAAAWLAWLRDHEGLDEVIALGHSEGSLVTMVAAQQTKLNGYISLAGAGRPADQVLRSQLAAQGPQVTAMTDPILDSLVAGKTVADVNPMLASLFRPSVQPYLISWFQYDPAEAIAQLDVPVLLINGTTDIQVPTSEAELLAEAQPNAELVIVEGMNHILKEAPADRMANIATYSKPNLPLVPALTETMVSFVQKIE